MLKNTKSNAEDACFNRSEKIKDNDSHTARYLPDRINSKNTISYGCKNFANGKPLEPSYAAQTATSPL